MVEEQARLLFETWLCGTGSTNGLGMTALNGACYLLCAVSAQATGAETVKEAAAPVLDSLLGQVR